MTVTRARQNFFKLIEKAGEPSMAVTITVEGEPKVIMMSAEDFEGWQETLDIIADKELMKAIRQGLRGKKVYTEKEIKKEFHLK